MLANRVLPSLQIGVTLGLLTTPSVSQQASVKISRKHSETHLQQGCFFEWQQLLEIVCRERKGKSVYQRRFHTCCLFASGQNSFGLPLFEV